jgi:hypothetical protein
MQMGYEGCTMHKSISQSLHHFREIVHDLNCPNGALRHRLRASSF